MFHLSSHRQSTGWFWNCCQGFAAQRLLGSKGAAVWCCYFFHMLWAFCGMGGSRRGPMPEACTFLSESSFLGLPSCGWWCCWKQSLLSRILSRGQAASILLLLPLQFTSDPRVSVPICVILLTEKEGISAWTCHILWPVAHWDGRWWQNKQHSFSQSLSGSLRNIGRAVLTPWNTPAPSIKSDKSSSSCTLWRAEGKGWQNLKGNFPSLPSSRWKTFPRKRLLETLCWHTALPRERASGGAALVLSHGRTQGWGGGKGPPGICLGERTLWEGPVWRVSGKFWPQAGGWDWLLAQRFSMRHDNTLKVSLIHVFFSQGFYRNPCLTKCWIQI